MWKNKVKALIPLAIMAGAAAATYTPTYTTSDIQPGIIDVIGGIIVGIAGQNTVIGQAIALTISIGLLIGLLLLVLRSVGKIKRDASGMTKGD